MPGTSSLGGKHVCDGSVTLNGTPIDKLASYRVTMNSFLASGGDRFGVFDQGTEQLGGDLDLDALEVYFAAHSPMAPGLRNRILQVVSCD